MDEIVDKQNEISCDVLVIGGGTAGPMAALKAKLDESQGDGHPAREGERQALRRHLDGHGRAEQRRHSRLRDARAVHQGNHHRQRRHRQPEGRSTNMPQTLLLDHRGARQLRHPLPEERERRLRGQEGASHRHLRAADAERRDGQEGALPPAPARAAADLQPLHGDAPARPARRPHRRRDRGQHAHGRIPRHPRQGRDPVHGRRRPARPADLGLSVRHLRERRQLRRRLRDGLSRRRGAREPRMLPDQSADQGLQRPGLRLCRGPVRRLHRQQQGPALHRVRLLVRPDDAGVLQRAAVRQRAGVPQAQSSACRHGRRDRGHPAQGRAPEPRRASTQGAAPTTARA